LRALLLTVYNLGRAVVGIYVAVAPPAGVHAWSEERQQGLFP